MKKMSILWSISIFALFVNGYCSRSRNLGDGGSNSGTQNSDASVNNGSRSSDVSIVDSPIDEEANPPEESTRSPFKTITELKQEIKGEYWPQIKKYCQRSNC